MDSQMRHVEDDYETRPLMQCASSIILNDAVLIYREQFQLEDIACGTLGNLNVSIVLEIFLNYENSLMTIINGFFFVSTHFWIIFNFFLYFPMDLSMLLQTIKINYSIHWLNCNKPSFNHFVDESIVLLLILFFLFGIVQPHKRYNDAERIAI